MSQNRPPSRIRVVRGSKRAHYDSETLYKVLDAGFICNVAYLFENSPVIIPTAYCREGDIIYIHGALKNRMMTSLLAQDQATVSVTHVDGLVLARSTFHHSMNYRSAVIFGKPVEVKEAEEKNRILKLITNNILADRWDETRLPTEHELAITLVIGIKIEEASVKIRTGAPVDDEEDYKLPLWSGELPIINSFALPITDESGVKGLAVPKSVTKALKNNRDE